MMPIHVNHIILQLVYYDRDNDIINNLVHVPPPQIIYESTCVPTLPMPINFSMDLSRSWVSESTHFGM